MKKFTALSVALAMAGALSVPQAQAADGSITFEGTIVASTCTADVNGEGANGNVKLDTVSWADLENVGDTAGPTAFTITLDGCSFGPGDDKWIRPEFSQSNVNPATGDLSNINGGMSAQDVEVRISNASMMPINLLTNENNEWQATEDSASFNYYASYVRAATGGEALGSVNTVAMFSVKYQ